jgi:hypothetical protein
MCNEQYRVITGLVTGHDSHLHIMGSQNVLCVGSAELRKKPQLMFCAYLSVFFLRGVLWGSLRMLEI